MLWQRQGQNNKAVRALLDLSGVKLEEDGKLAGFAEQLEALQKSDGYLFAETQQPTFRGFQPGAGSGAPPNRSVDVSKMTMMNCAPIWSKIRVQN